jgi:hypothetical protein
MEQQLKTTQLVGFTSFRLGALLSDDSVFGSEPHGLPLHLPACDAVARDHGPPYHGLTLQPCFGRKDDLPSHPTAGG